MSGQWDFAYLLPNAAFDEPIENEYLALVPPNDQRLLDLTAKHPAVKKLAHSFHNQFREKVHPSALLFNLSRIKEIDFRAIVGFRNAIALSSLIKAWSWKLAGNSAGYPTYSDYFDFYPYTVSKGGDDLIGKSAAIWAFDGHDKFSGQSPAHLPNAESLTFGIDQTILKGCLALWARRYIRNRKERKSNVLFRSLEIAYAAARVPAVGHQNPTIHDVGVGVALWVSAMEILSHPRTGNASFETVTDLLSRLTFTDQNLNARRHRRRRGKKFVQLTFIQALYYDLYQARNDFLHGNPVTLGSLFARKRLESPNLFYCAPLIYRVALTSFLNKAVSTKPSNDIDGYVTQFCETSNFEEAVLECLKKLQKK